MQLHKKGSDLYSFNHTSSTWGYLVYLTVNSLLIHCKEDNAIIKDYFLQEAFADHQSQNNSSL